MYKKRSEIDMGERKETEAVKEYKNGRTKTA
jgi:hypothetical protein